MKQLTTYNNNNKSDMLETKQRADIHKLLFYKMSANPCEENEAPH